MTRGTPVGLLVVLLLTVGVVAPARATTITFNEGLVPVGTLLDGTTAYSPFDVTFDNAFLFGPDDRLPDDGFGITNTAAVSVVHFIYPVSNVGFTWATAAGGVSFFATLFDASNHILGSFSFDGSQQPTPAHGTALFILSNVSRLEFHDGGQVVALDTLSFTPTPEPASLLLIGTGLVGLVIRRARGARLN